MEPPIVVAADVAPIEMGCVQAKSTSMSSPTCGLEKLKLDHDYVGGVKRQPADGFAANGGAGEREGRGDAGNDVDREGDGKAVKRTTDGEVGISRRRTSVPLHPAPVPVVMPSLPAGFEGGTEEMVGGWPRWLSDNIPGEVLAKFIPKSAENYVMIEKVAGFWMLNFHLIYPSSTVQFESIIINRAGYLDLHSFCMYFYLEFVRPEG